MCNDNINHYLNNRGRWSIYRSEERRLELQRQREEDVTRRNPLQSNRVETVYKNAVNLLYKLQPE